MSNPMTVPVFYVLGESDYESNTTLRLRVERRGLTGPQLIRGEFPSEPISARPHLGSAPADYTDMGVRVVSMTFRDAVARHGLSGAVFAALTVGDDSSHWFLMGVIGRCGRFDYSASKRFERVIHHSGGGEWRGTYLRGFAIDPATWSGDDFFLPPRVNRVVVTERVVAALDGVGLTNLQFTPTSSYEIEEGTALTFAQADGGL